MMRRVLLIVSMLLIAAVCQASDKVSQLPETDPSYDFASMAYDPALYLVVMADDWTCPDGKPISEIKWWGSYWTPPMPGSFTPYSDTLNGAAPGGVVEFLIGIFPNLPAGGNMPFEHPDYNAPLAGWSAPIALVNETFAFAVTRPLNPAVSADVYSYSLDLSQATSLVGTQTSFAQQQGTKYWLALGARLTDGSKQWGWHEADAHYGSYAVQTLGGTSEQPGWYIPCGGHDMAFELSVIPEPGSLVACLVGVTGLVGCVKRSRRRAV